MKKSEFAVEKQNHLMIKKTNSIPENSLLRIKEEPFHYVDSFQSEVLDKSKEWSISELLAVFMSSGPRWANVLMEIRNKTVRLFGLKAANTNQTAPSITDIENCVAGDSMGIFKVHDKSKNEVLMGEGDKHLNFMVSFLSTPPSTKDEKQIFSITTAVHFNNIAGRLYFLPVKPFHKLLIYYNLKKAMKVIKAK